MKLKRRLVSFVVAGLMAVVPCVSLASSAATHLKYDANGDNVENLADAIYILQYLSGVFEPTHPEYCDINGNGIVSIVDADMIEWHCIDMLEVNDVE